MTSPFNGSSENQEKEKQPVQNKVNAKQIDVNADDELLNHVNRVLDNTVDNLSDSQLTDIARARQTALRANQASNTSNDNGFMTFVTNYVNALTLTPVAVAVCIGVLVHYFSSNNLNHQDVSHLASHIELPAGLIDDEMPTEELALLQDLEFVDWLAEQESFSTETQSSEVVL